jgi:hypothetical protein
MVSHYSEEEDVQNILGTQIGHYSEKIHIYFLSELEPPTIKQPQKEMHFWGIIS